MSWFSRLSGWEPDLVGVFAGGVVLIRHGQLRVEAAAEQQLEQSLLAGRQILTGVDRLLQLGHVVTQLKLHFLFWKKIKREERKGGRKT